MELEYAFFAHGAEVSPDGKLYVLGGDFDSLEGSVFPFEAPDLSLVVRLRATPAECGQEHRFEAAIADGSGHRLPPEIHLPFIPAPNPRHPERPVRVGLAITLRGLVFPRPGTYLLGISVDGREWGRQLPLYLTPQAAGAGCAEG